MNPFIAINILDPQIQYLHSLDDDKVKYLSWYTENEDVNKYLRRLPIDEKYVDNVIETLDNVNSIFSGIPLLSENIIVYRGLDCKFIEQEIQRSFIWTTLSIEVGKWFVNKENSCLLEITVPVGSRVIPLLDDFKLGDNEYAVLLDKGRLIVTGEERASLAFEALPSKEKEGKDYRHLYCSYIPDNAIDLLDYNSNN